MQAQRVCSRERIIALIKRSSINQYSPCAHCTPNKSVPTLCYTHRQGPKYVYRSMPVGTYQVQSPVFLKIVYYQDHAIHLTHQTELKKKRKKRGLWLYSCIPGLSKQKQIQTPQKVTYIHVHSTDQFLQNEGAGRGVGKGVRTGGGGGGGMA